MIDLEQIRTTLKNEFIAIDHIIDRIVESIKLWINSDKMMSPNIICLWGMTGTGKTKLVQRLAELLGMKDDMFYLNMVDAESSRESINRVIEDEEVVTNPKSIFVIDEFQNCYTTDPDNGDKVERKELNVIWDLFDSGKFIVKKYPIELYNVAGFLKECNSVFKEGLQNMKKGSLKSVTIH